MHRSTVGEQQSAVMMHTPAGSTIEKKKVITWHATFTCNKTKLSTRTAEAIYTSRRSEPCLGRSGASPCARLFRLPHVRADEQTAGGRPAQADAELGPPALAGAPPLDLLHSSLSLNGYSWLSPTLQAAVEINPGAEGLLPGATDPLHAHSGCLVALSMDMVPRVSWLM
jgi:hypothetical protein